LFDNGAEVYHYEHILLVPAYAMSINNSEDNIIYHSIVSYMVYGEEDIPKSNI
jgi:hypothetical protein